MAVEIKDFVEAVQFCIEKSNGDELKRLLSLRHNAMLSRRAAVSVAVKVCLAAGLDAISAAHICRFCSVQNQYLRLFQEDSA